MTQRKDPTTPSLVARANRNRDKGGRSWVYFIQAESGPVKIGQSREIARRLVVLQAAHFEKLTLIGMVPETLVPERKLLDRFSPHRIRGEWFAPEPDLLALAEAGYAAYREGFQHMLDHVSDEQRSVLIAANMGLSWRKETEALGYVPKARFLRNPSLAEIERLGAEA